MLTKQELEDLIKAWPDENGETNDPDTNKAYSNIIFWYFFPIF